MQLQGSIARVATSICQTRGGSCTVESATVYARRGGALGYVEPGQCHAQAPEESA